MKKIVIGLSLLFVLSQPVFAGGQVPKQMVFPSSMICVMDERIQRAEQRIQDCITQYGQEQCTTNTAYMNAAISYLRAKKTQFQALDPLKKYDCWQQDACPGISFGSACS